MADAEIAVILKLIASEFQQKLKESEEQLGSFAGVSVTAWSKIGATVLTTGAALVAIARESGKAAEELDHLSQKTGISTQVFQEWSVVMARNQLGPEQMAAGMRGLSKAMVEAQEGTGRGAEVFKALGISAVDAAGNLRSPDAVLLQVADKFAGMKDGAGKAGLAVDLFSRSGLGMIPMLNLGAQGIKDLEEQSYRLGAVLGDVKDQKLLGLDDAFDDVNVAVAAFKKNLSAFMTDVGFVSFIKNATLGMADLSKALEHPWDMLAIRVVNATAYLEIAMATAGRFWAKMLSPPKSIFGGMLTPDDDAYAAKLAAIEQKRASSVGYLRGDDKPHEKPKTDTRPDPPIIQKTLTGAGAKAELKTQEDELKAELDGYKFFSKQKEQVLQTRILKENLDERQAATERLAIRRDETALQVLAIQKMLPLLADAHQKELTAAGSNAEKKLAADENHKQKYIKYTADIQKLLDEQVIAEGEAINKSIALNLKKQETIGKMLLDHFKLVEDLNQKAFKDEDTRLASSVAIGDKQLLGSVEMAERRVRLIKSQIATLKADPDVGGENKYKIAELEADMDQQNEIASNSFVKGWARGMKQFTRDSTGAFGMAQTMARDTAQAMTNGFQGLFFDAMQGKFHSLRDTASSVLTFMQQMASKILAQWATTQMMGGEGAPGGGGGLLGMAGGLLGGLFGGGSTAGDAGVIAASARGLANPALLGPAFAEGGMVRRYFGTGGPVGTDTVPAWLTPGEGVLSTKGMAALGRLNAGGGGGVNISMTINTPDANSFRHSADQIMGQAQTAMSRSQRNM